LECVFCCKRFGIGLSDAEGRLAQVDGGGTAYKVCVADVARALWVKEVSVLAYDGVKGVGAVSSAIDYDERQGLVEEVQG
jgi:hypothetical protein